MPADDIAPDVGQLVATIGQTVRSLRKERALTLDQLAASTGLSTGMVSQLERGIGNPSFATLVQLAHGLGVPVGRLLFVEEGSSPVVRAKERRRLALHGIPSDDNVVYEMLTPDLTGALQATWVSSKPGHDTSAAPFQHSGEEFGIVISGQVDVHVGTASYHLEAGDAVRFSSTIPHWFVNRGPDPAEVIWVSTPPSW